MRGIRFARWHGGIRKDSRFLEEERLFEETAIVGVKGEVCQRGWDEETNDQW